MKRLGLGGLICWLGIFGAVFAQGRPVTVQMDCREGIGLIPSLWRGVRGEGAHIPEGVEIRTVCLWTEAVRSAWEPKRLGGVFAWSALDEVLVRLQGSEVVLPLPVMDVAKEQWIDLVRETVNHVGNRVKRFEIVDDTGSDLERYLQFYESGVWTVYGVDAKARVGGPGRDWKQGWVEALIGRCKTASLPLHFVSWSVMVEQAGDLRESIATVEEWVNQAGLTERPKLLVSQWQTTDTGGLALNLSALVEVLNSDVEAVCTKSWANDSGVTALQAMEALEGVRLPIHIDGRDSVVAGIASIEEPNLLAFFWAKQPGEPIPMTVLFTGLPRGFLVRVKHLQIRSGAWVTEPILEETLSVKEPVRVTFPLEAGVLRGIRLEVE
ncbi:MAG: hypothetical protein O7G87_22385 [bacterium]|nr:hypothetical protein [bacterium]